MYLYRWIEHNFTNKRNNANVSSTQIKYTFDNYELFEGCIINSYSLQLLSNHYWRTNNIRSSWMTEEQEEALDNFCFQVMKELTHRQITNKYAIKYTYY